MLSSSDRLISELEQKIGSGELSKAEIKRKTGFSSSLLETYLQRRSTPGLDAADKIAAAIGKDLGDILRNPKRAVSSDQQIIAEFLGILAEITQTPIGRASLSEAILAVLKNSRSANKSAQRGSRKEKESEE